MGRFGGLKEVCLVEGGWWVVSTAYLAHNGVPGNCGEAGEGGGRERGGWRMEGVSVVGEGEAGSRALGQRQSLRE